MKRIILYAFAFVLLIPLFWFVSTRVDTQAYRRMKSQRDFQTAASELSPADIITSSLEAYGGMEKIGSIEEIFLKNNIVVFDQHQQSLRGESTEYYRFPDKVRVDFHFDADEVTHLYNGIEAWTQTGQEIAKAPDYLSEGLRRSVKHFPTTLLLSALDERSFLSPVDPRIEDDRMIYSLKITDRENDFSEIWIDSETLLMDRIEYVLYSSLGADTMAIVIDDYRPVDGIQTAFSATIFYNGERAQETKIEEVRYNPGLSDSLFVLRAPEE